MASTALRKERTSTDLTQKELAMLRAATKLSDKEIKQWHTEFIHKYPTGKLDKKTFIETFKQLYPHEKPTAPIETVFDSLDKNKDGAIDFNEFLFIVAVSSTHGSLDDRLDIIFDLWDVSHDKLLDVNELAHLISAMYDRTGVKDRQHDKNPTARAKAIIGKLDSSGDKKLNRTEFITGCKNDEVIRKLLSPDQ